MLLAVKDGTEDSADGATHLVNPLQDIAGTPESNKPASDAGRPHPFGGLDIRVPVTCCYPPAVPTCATGPPRRAMPLTTFCELEGEGEDPGKEPSRQLMGAN